MSEAVKNPCGKNHCFNSNFREKCSYLKGTYCSLFDIELDYREYVLGDSKGKVWYRCEKCKLDSDSV